MINKRAAVGLAALLMLQTDVAYSQNELSTKGPCSHNVAGNEGEINITCIGYFDDESRQKIGRIVDVLNTVLAVEGDTEAILKRLEALGESVAGIAAVIDRQHQDENARRVEQERVERTPPKVDAELVRASNGEYQVWIKSINLLPFEATWSIVTEKSILVGAVMTGPEAIYPASERPTVRYRVGLQAAKVSNNYIELRFRYNALSYAKLGRPDNLRGEIVKQYEFVKGEIVPR